MIWTTTAIAAAAITGVISIIDSHLISKRMPSFPAFLAPVGLLHLVCGLVILSIEPLPPGVSAWVITVAIGSSIIRVTGALLMLRTMRTEEVSRIMPVVNTFPIFVAILAVPVLGESLGWVEWLAIIITVSGAVLISVHREPEKRGVKLRRSFATLMFSSILMGVANIGSKYALEYITSWNVYSITATCLGTISLLISLRPGTLREIREMAERNKALSLIVFNEGIAIGGIILSFRAMELGPISLVSTILGTRPAFVFIYALAVSYFFPAVLNERFSRGIIITRVVSIGLVVGGVTLLTL